MSLEEDNEDFQEALDEPQQEAERREERREAINDNPREDRAQRHTEDMDIIDLRRRLLQFRRTQSR